MLLGTETEGFVLFNETWSQAGIFGVMYDYTHFYVCKSIDQISAHTPNMDCQPVTADGQLIFLRDLRG